MLRGGRWLLNGAVKGGIPFWMLIGLPSNQGHLNIKAETGPAVDV